MGGSMDSIKQIMNGNVQTCTANATATEAARLMRDSDIGDVVVCQDDGSLIGILTDRDITRRSTAEGRHLDQVTVGDICTVELATLSPDGSAEEAVRLMREQAVRRLPVVHDGQCVGIVSIGDLAQVR